MLGDYLLDKSGNRRPSFQSPVSNSQPQNSIFDLTFISA